MKRKRNCKDMEPRRNLAAAVGALNTVLMSLEKLESEWEEDETFELLTLGAFINGAFDEEEQTNGGNGGTDEKKPTPQEYAEEIVLLFSVDDFKKQFGVHQRTFEILSQLVAPYTQKASTKVPGRAQIPAEKQLLIALWLLVNQESFRDVGVRFCVCRKTAWQCLHRVVRALVKINQERSVIQWPSIEKAQEVVDGFHSLSGFPGVMGVIDSTHIPIKAPPISADLYANPKGFHSVILQAVCDSRSLFIDCYIGEGGSTEDACVLSRSPLQQIMNSPALFPSNCHLLGEPSYPIQPHLLTVYSATDGCNLNERQKHYNECFTKCLDVVGRTFAIVKSRFRRLKRLEMSRVDMIPETIMACCVLHNICIQLEDVPDEPDEELQPLREERVATTEVDELKDEAIAKREEIASALYFENKR